MKDNPTDLLVILAQKWVAYGACRDKKRSLVLEQGARAIERIIVKQLKQVLTPEQANALLWVWTNEREGNGDAPLTVAQARAITARLRHAANPRPRAAK